MKAEKKNRITELEVRVNKFNCMQLPGQPMACHMGTHKLVNDLWRLIKEEKDREDANEKVRQEKAAKFSGFIDECCVLGPGLREKGVVLYFRFEAWHQNNVGEKIPSLFWFSNQLEKKFSRDPDGSSFFSGIALSSPLPESDR